MAEDGSHVDTRSSVRSKRKRVALPQSSSASPPSETAPIIIVSVSKPPAPPVLPELRGLNCAVCSLPYDGSQRKPKSLQCLHTFCGACLDVIELSRPEGIRCPLCMTTTGRGNQVLVNYALMEVMEQVQAVTQPSKREAGVPSGQQTHAASSSATTAQAAPNVRNPVKCSECMDDNIIAVRYCVDCVASLCVTHARAHALSRKTHTHALATIDSPLGFSSNPLMQSSRSFTLPGTT